MKPVIADLSLSLLRYTIPKKEFSLTIFLPQMTKIIKENIKKK
jgi:hypothetical protein